MADSLGSNGASMVGLSLRGTSAGAYNTPPSTPSTIRRMTNQAPMPAAPSQGYAGPSRESQQALQQRQDYVHSSFQDYYNRLTPQEKQGYTSAAPAGKLSSTDAQGRTTVSNSMPGEIAAGQENATKRAAFADYQKKLDAGALASRTTPGGIDYQGGYDKHNQAYKSILEHGPGYTPPAEDPNSASALQKMKGDQAMAVEKERNANKPGTGERLLTGLGSGIKSMVETGMKELGATQRNDATNKSREAIAGQNNTTKEGIAANGKVPAAKTPEERATENEFIAAHGKWAAATQKKAIDPSAPDPGKESKYTKRSGSPAASANWADRERDQSGNGVGGGGATPNVAPGTSAQPAASAPIAQASSTIPPGHNAYDPKKEYAEGALGIDKDGRQLQYKGGKWALTESATK